MDGFITIAALVGFLILGAILPRLHMAPSARIVELLIKASLWALLFAMGYRIGSDPRLLPRIGEIGLMAAATAVLAVAGTLLAIIAAQALLGLAGRRMGPADAAGSRDAHSRGAGGGLDSGSSAGPGSHIKAPALLLGIVVLGFSLGLLLAPPAFLDLDALTGWILRALLLFIGMQFSQSGVSLRAAFLRPQTILVPVATAVGSLAGGCLVALLFGLSPWRGMSLAAGFGWYSLSGVIISNLGDPALGSVAFLSNMIRESIALLAIPFLAATRLPVLAVGVAGATAMDVTLPLIEQCAGPAILPLSFASGALLSLSVPLLVPLLFRLG